MFFFFEGNYGLSFQVLRQIVYVGFGSGEFFEICRAAQNVDPKVPDSWFNAWKEAGDEAARQGAIALEAGNRLTAGHRYQCASGYYRAGEFYLKPGDPRKMPLYEQLLDCFDKGVELQGETMEKVQIPYEDSFLHALYVPARTDGKKAPCVVLFGGLDSIKEELYFQLHNEWTRRGLSLLMVDGPGQGATLRFNHICSRYDYEAAGTAAYDYLLTRDDVDPDRVAVCALSMGGYYASRIASFEHRYAAVVAWGAQYDYGKVWQNRPETHDLAMHVQWIMGVDNMEAARRKVAAYRLTPEILSGVTCPALILHGQRDRQIPLEDARSLYDGMCNSPLRELRVFEDAEGGVEHCQGDFGYLAVSYAGDWLAKLFGTEH